MTSWPVRLIPAPETVGDALRRLRTERGLDQKAVWSALNMTQSGYNNYETGKTRPSRDILDRLDAFFGLPPRTLWGIFTAYRDWEESQEPLPGEAIAVPYREAHAALYERVYDWDDTAIHALIKQAEQIERAQAQHKPRRRKDPHRELTEEDWDGDERVAG